MKLNRLLLASCTSMLAITLVACGSGNPQAHDGDTEASFLECHLLDQEKYGLIHEDNSSLLSGVDFWTKDEGCPYTFVVKDKENTGDIATEAANMIARHFKNALDLEITIINVDEIKEEITRDTKYTFIGCDSLFSAKGFVYPAKLTSVMTGYTLQSYGNNVFVQAKRRGGYQMGSIKFLETLIGFTLLNYNNPIYSKVELDTESLPMYSFDVVEQSDNDMKCSSTGLMDKTYLYDSGFSTSLYFPIINFSISNIHNDWQVMNRCYLDPQLLGAHCSECATGVYVEAEKEEAKNPGHTFKYYVCSSCGHLAKEFPKNYYDDEESGWGFHNEWFADFVTVDYANVEWRETCFTAHGNAEERELLIRYIAELAITVMLKNPTINGWGFNMGDGSDMDCTCAECLKYKNYFSKGWLAAIYCQFFNGVTDIIQNYIADDTRDNLDVIPTDHVFRVSFLAYHQAVYAPVKRGNDGLPIKNAQGEYVPVDISNSDLSCKNEVFLHKGVAPYLASSSSDYRYSFYEHQNYDIAETMLAWKPVINEYEGAAAFVWTYAINFNAYFLPYNSWLSTVENYRFFTSIGSKLHFNQNNSSNSRGSAFNDLKTFLGAQFSHNCNYDYKERVDYYFRYAFYDAYEPMRKLFDSMCAYTTSHADNLTSIIHGAADISQKRWSLGLVREWQGYIDEAFSLIEPLKKTNPTRYEAVRGNILCESFCPRYMMIFIYNDEYTTDQLREERISFLNDCESMSISRVAEHSPMWFSTLRESWGI